MRPGYLLIAAIVLFSCGPSGREKTQSKAKTYAAVYADLLQSNIKLKNMGVDTTTAMRDADSVLARHGVTREEYESMIRSYGQDPAQWKAFLEEVGLILGQETNPVTPLSPRP